MLFHTHVFFCFFHLVHNRALYGRHATPMLFAMSLWVTYECVKFRVHRGGADYVLESISDASLSNVRKILACVILLSCILLMEKL
jgi:hypothetical protein